MASSRYFNFPIELLNGFLLDPKKVLSDIADYAVYSNAQELEYGNDIERFKSSAKYFNINFGNIQKSYERGESLFNSIEPGGPKTGLESNAYWDFYKNHKSEFEIVCLLGFLALKSILMDKAYCKVTNDFWLSRMDGNPKSVDKRKLSKEIQIYHTEYQTKKIKNELVLNWNLITYSRYTRGFYVSFKLNLNDLVFQAEKKRRSYQEKKLKQETENARQKALERLNNAEEI